MCGTEAEWAPQRLTLEYHPDKTGNDTAKTEIFKSIQTAYETLSNPQRRRAYDSIDQVLSLSLSLSF
jgi:DnaJ-class molecular chaperone